MKMLFMGMIENNTIISSLNVNPFTGLDIMRTFNPADDHDAAGRNIKSHRRLLD